MDLTAWLQLLALHDHDARRWEPKRLRLRLFSIAGRIARHARRTRLRLAAHAPWPDLLTAALARLQPRLTSTNPAPTTGKDNHTRARGTRQEPAGRHGSPNPKPEFKINRQIRTRSGRHVSRAQDLG
jgi:Transposase DDE domain group 1